MIDEIDLPGWYWWGLALGWIALGVINDVADEWVRGAATLIFGAVHAAVAPRVISGRHRSRRLSVGAEVAGRHVAWLVIAGLIGLGALTVAGALAAADGARHPATMASVLVAVIVVLGGPQLLAVIRRRAARAAASS